MGIVTTIAPIALALLMLGLGASLTIQDFLFSRQLLIFMQENKIKTEKFIDKTSIIIPNEFIRKNINYCIFNFYKPIKPNKITDTLENALHFLNE